MMIAQCTIVGRLAFGWILVLHCTLPVGVAEPTSPSSPPARTIHFPSDRSLGRVWIREWDFPPFDVARGGTAEARGDVRIPAGKAAVLQVFRINGVIPSLEPLAPMGPDDLQAIRFEPAGGPREEDLDHLKGLTGLRELRLADGIGKTGLSHLAGLPRLESLSFSASRGLGDGLAYLERLPSLRNLGFSSYYIGDSDISYLGRLSRLRSLSVSCESVTDAGFSFLQSLGSLEVLSIRGKQMTAAGLRFLKDMSRLRELSLTCPLVGDEGLELLAGISSLERLRFTGSRFSAEGLRHLEKMKSLQHLYFCEVQFGEKSLEPIGRVTSLRSLELVRNHLRDDDLSYLRNLPALQRLGLDDGNITDAGLAHLAALQSLESLSLGATKATGKGLAPLAQLRNLTFLMISRTSTKGIPLAFPPGGFPALANLGLSYTDVGDEELADLKNLRSLRYLSLGQTQVTDAALAKIGELPQLVSLDLRSTRVTDEGLAHLKPNRALARLYIPFTNIGNAGLAHLTSLTSLTMLQLQGTRINDGALEHLEKMPALQQLTVDPRQFSEAGLARLRKLPARDLTMEYMPVGQVASRLPDTLTTLTRAASSGPDTAFLASNMLRTLGKGWKGGVVKEGLVRPDQFSEGEGVYLRFDTDPDSASLSPYGCRTAHLWLMEVAYKPTRLSGPASSALAHARYLGRTDQFRAFFRGDYVDRRIRAHSEITGPLTAGLMVKPLAGLDLVERGLGSADRNAKMAAIDELFLLLTHGTINEFIMERWNANARVEAAVQNDEALRQHLQTLYTPNDVLFSLSRMKLAEPVTSPPTVLGVLWEAVKERADLTEAIYNYCLSERNTEGFFYFGLGSVLKMMAPSSSSETLRAALRSTNLLFLDKEQPEKLAQVAVHHAVTGRVPGLAREMAPFVGIFRNEDLRGQALQYFRVVRDPTVARDIFKQVCEGIPPPQDPFMMSQVRAMQARLLNFSGLPEVREFHRFPTIHADGTLDPPDLPWSWRGNLDLFCTLPVSEDFLADMLEYLQRRELDKGIEEGSREHMATVFALNFLIRNPVEGSLPRLLSFLDKGPDMKMRGLDALVRVPTESQTLYEQTVLNPANVINVCAAQAIIRLGPETSPRVLEYLKRRIGIKGGAPLAPVPPPDFIIGGDFERSLKPSEIELALLILGFLANQEVYGDFAELAPKLEGKYLETWKVADGWFREGGRKMILPPAPKE